MVAGCIWHVLSAFSSTPPSVVGVARQVVRLRPYRTLPELIARHKCSCSCAYALEQMNSAFSNTVVSYDIFGVAKAILLDIFLLVVMCMIMKFISCEL